MCVREKPFAQATLTQLSTLRQGGPSPPLDDEGISGHARLQG